MTRALGIRANRRPFLEQLAQVFFVGMTVGLQRTVIPAPAETEFKRIQALTKKMLSNDPATHRWTGAAVQPFRSDPIAFAAFQFGPDGRLFCGQHRFGRTR